MNSYEHFINKQLNKESGMDPTLALIVASLLNAQQDPVPLHYIDEPSPEEQMAYTFQVLRDGQENMPYPEGPHGSSPMSLADIINSEGEDEDE